MIVFDALNYNKSLVLFPLPQPKVLANLLFKTLSYWSYLQSPTHLDGESPAHLDESPTHLDGERESQLYIKGWNLMHSQSRSSRGPVHKSYGEKCKYPAAL